MSQQITVKNRWIDLVNEANDFLGILPNRSSQRELILLLSHILNKRTIDIYLGDFEITGKDRSLFFQLAGELAASRPLQYILGKTCFLDVELKVTEGVFIPRPETEILVDAVIKSAAYKREDVTKMIHIADIGTGSGAIAISLTKSLDNCRILATDISKEALEIARFNAVRNNADKNIEFACTDILKGIRNKKFDIIVSNPPYIKYSDINALPVQVRREPFIALNGGDDGFLFYRRITSETTNFLNNGATMALEVGDDQADGVKEILSKKGFKSIKTIKDLNSADRVILAQWIN